MNLDIYQVDAFTSAPFKGNPAGVCITEQPLSEELMFSIAQEMAVSETAFLTLSNMNLRWFTPEIEVKLCGHGTLAMTHILVERGDLNIGESVTFQTLSGPLNAAVLEDGIELDFPQTNLQLDQEFNVPLLEALGIKPQDIAAYGEFDSKVFIQVNSESTVLGLTPNFDAMKRLQGRGAVVTAPSNDESLDFISRYFAPWVGVNEDPVTGSAHCALGQFWSQKLNKTTLTAYQASKRGGDVTVEVLANQRIKLMGTAKTTINGVINL
jgi:PhzF family phenazine biosynthesis protein